MTSDCGASSHFVDSHLVGNIESRIKDIVKIDPPATIDIANHSMLSGVGVGTLIIRVTDTEDFLHDMLLPTTSVPEYGRHLISRGTSVLKGVNTAIAKKSFIDVGQFKIFLHKDTDRPTIDYCDLELSP